MLIPREWARVLFEARQRAWPLGSFLSHFAGMDSRSTHLYGCRSSDDDLVPLDLYRVRPASDVSSCCPCCTSPPSSFTQDLGALEALLAQAGPLGALGDDILRVLEGVAAWDEPLPLGYEFWALLTRASQQLEAVQALGGAGDLAEAAQRLLSEVSPLVAELRFRCEEGGRALLIEEALAYHAVPVLRLVQRTRTGEAVAAAWGSHVLVGEWLLAAAPGLPCIRALEVSEEVPGDLTSVAQVAAALHASAARGDALFDPVKAVRAALLLT